MNGERTTLKTDSATGNSTDAYTSIATIQLVFHRRLGLIVKNTGLTNGILVKIISKISSTGVLEYEELGETTLTAGSSLRYFENDLMGEVQVQIKSSVAGQASSYSIEWAIDRP